MKHQFAEYQRRIIELRMLRTDLDEATIVKEAQKLAYSRPNTVLDILDWCKEIAMEGKPLPWEQTDNPKIQQSLRAGPK